MTISAYWARQLFRTSFSTLVERVLLQNTFIFVLEALESIMSEETIKNFKLVPNLLKTSSHLLSEHPGKVLQWWSPAMKSVSRAFDSGRSTSSYNFLEDLDGVM